MGENESTGSASAARLRAEHLCKIYQPGRKQEVVAVRDASFEVGPGEVLGLLGPNGAGKTTLLRMLATIIRPTSGVCWVEGERSDQASRAIRGQIGFLSGNTRLYGRLTGREVLAYFGRLYNLDDDWVAERIAELSEVLDMGAFLDRRCETFSTGQTQKVSIARVMLHDPPVLILDEPTLGLDIMTSRSILDFIIRAKERDRAIIFSTHYMTEAELLCDRIGLIYRGDIMALGSKADVYDSTGTDNLHDAFLALIESREGARA